MNPPLLFSAARCATDTFLFIAIITGTATPAVAQQNAREVAYFERSIRPILVKHCYECHSTESDEIGGGFRLDDRDSMRQGGESGPGIVPGNLQKSLVMQAMEYRDMEMPPDGKLPDDVLRQFRRWIKKGAHDPRDAAEEPKGPPVEQEVEVERLWSLEPISPVTIPAVQTTSWPKNDIDRFILARAEAEDLPVAAAAAPSEWLRRTYYAIVGLPPSPEVLAAYVADPSELHQERIVDELLNSKEFGERWGRHWLDAVRFGESAGNSRDVLTLYAWRYRNYVIDAFNDDIPFDRFLQEQIAGDLLEADNEQERARLQIATGMLAVGSKSLNGGNVELDLVDDQIDVIGKAVLGLTISCARCHDHKFDPIPTADYYALAGIFRNTETFYGGSTNRPKTTADRLKAYLPLVDAEQALVLATASKQLANVQKKQTAAKKRFQNLAKKLPKNWRQILKMAEEEAARAADEPAENQDQNAAEDGVKGDDENGDGGATVNAKTLAQIKSWQTAREQFIAFDTQLKSLQDAFVEPEFAVGVADKKSVKDWPIQLRGERTKAGDVVPRGFLSCVAATDSPSISADKSGRQELADWLTHADQTLTPRVYVNRVWMHLFGRGIVDSVDNFGRRGSTPTHPELLDFLANRLVHEHHWQLKPLIRDLVLTRTFGQSSASTALHLELDPENLLVTRMVRQRLSAEAIRDSMLHLSGELKESRPEGSPLLEVGEGEVGRGIKTEPLTRFMPHRSIYLPIVRGIVPEALKLFDFPEPSNPQGQRHSSHVPAQSLYMMNSAFAQRCASGLAERTLSSATNNAGRIEFLFLSCFNRPPNPQETSTTEAGLLRLQQELGGDEKAAWRAVAQAMFATAEFQYSP